MRKKVLFGIRCISFLLLVLVIIHGVNTVLTPKFLSDSTVWQTTATYSDFYEMEQDTIDVLFFGSSHAASGFNPQVLYNNYGIKSYNLGCEQQNLLVSYYWLKEALKYQKPKAIIVDDYMLFTYNKYEPLNTAESCTRKALDSMKWSLNKLEAVNSIAKNDENQTLNSYLFPNVRYHSRWEELQESDFTYKLMENSYEMKGYCPLNKKNGNVDYTPFAIDENVEEAELVPLMKEYLDKIVELCDNNNIDLILAETPTHNISNGSKYNAISEYAESNSLTFWDFDEESLYNEIEFNFHDDMNDDGHANVWGAEKISLYIAAKLYSDFGIMGGEGYEQWLISDTSYKAIMEEAELMHITDIYEYLEAINRDRYAVLISVQGNGSFLLSDDELSTRLKALGLSLNLETNYSYYAAIREGIVDEKTSAEGLTFYGNTRGRLIDFEISSMGYESGNKVSSIKINDVEKTNINFGGAGIKIVVYSNDRCNVVDSIFFNGQIMR